ncbi:hypothetical protein, partial [Acinetobacter baumannii]|uniref:hypothetical protein n=1 Tax=Acinetobacter baumannii TaxID=470 RepID=UPI00286F65D2
SSKCTNVSSRKPNADPLAVGGLSPGGTCSSAPPSAPLPAPGGILVILCDQSHEYIRRRANFVNQIGNYGKRFP